MDLSNAQVALLVAGYSTVPQAGPYASIPSATEIYKRAEILKKWLDDNS